jgi:hypothetical protein
LPLTAQAIFLLLKNERSSLFVLARRRIARKALVLEPYMRACAFRGELDRDDRFGAFGALPAGHPGDLNQAIGDEAQEPTIMRLAFTFEAAFEEVGFADIGAHAHAARRCKPFLEALRPCL